MRDWLSIELVLAVLLVTSFTCVGLLALWAGTSRRHWFVRTALVLAILSPLLVIPALEPFFVLALQSLLVALGVIVYRRKTTQRPANAGSPIDESAQPASRIRFSLTTLLLLMVLAAIGATVFVRFPRLTVPGWISILLNGALSGIATLSGAWMIVSTRKVWVWPLGIVVCIAVGGCLSAFDWFIPSITGIVSGWPPDPSTAALFGVSGTERPIVVWLVIPIGVAMLTMLFAFCWSAVVTTQLPSRWLRRCGLACLYFLAAAFPLYVLTKLLTPDPVPQNVLPVPNGYDELVAAGAIASATLFDGRLDVETATAMQLSPEVAKCTKAYDWSRPHWKNSALCPSTIRFRPTFCPLTNTCR
jgi:hypothetical protein